jgi:hypothetical protein
MSLAEYDPDTFKSYAFTNRFHRHIWIFENNERNPKNRDYFASDIAKYQYVSISKQEGFFGHLPSIIRRWAVSNFKTRFAVLGLESGSPEMLDAFMKTENGKSTQRILDDFGLKAVKIERTDNTFDVFVEPHPNRSTQTTSIAQISVENSPTEHSSISYETTPNNIPDTPFISKNLDMQTVGPPDRRVSITSLL